MKTYVFNEAQKDIIEMLPVPFAVYRLEDERIVTIALSRGFIQMLGFSMEKKQKAYDLMDDNMYLGTHPDDAARVAEAAIEFARSGGTYEEIYRARSSGDHAYRIIHAKGERAVTETGETICFTWYIDEGEYTASAGKDLEDLPSLLAESIHKQNLLKASYYDYLTGLPTMTYFFELAKAGKERILEEGGKPAMVFIDMNGMKMYNSNFGFARGDKLLISFAELLTKYFRRENCCRIGQDHFAFYSDEDGIEQKLYQIFDEWRAVKGREALSIRAGIYKDSMEDVDASTACDRAKYACDSMRNVYESSVAIFSREMLENAQRKSYILENLDRALEERWIEVYYQPIVRTMNGLVCDEEALARWNDPEKGMLSPAAFIPVLEESEQIYKLDLYVIDRVLEKINLMRSIGVPIVPQSVNLSRSDFENCDIIEEITKRVDAAGLEHEMLTIEITESIIGNNFEFMKAQIERFRELGFPVWMDDFGSGYSSLDLLKNIQFDLIKFDLRFMQELDQGEEGKIILTEMMRMAGSLGIDTLCEGVEKEGQLDFLSEIGCCRIQGYYFGRPLPQPELQRQFEAGKLLSCEDQKEAKYFDAIGRINLHNLDMILNKDAGDFSHYFNTLPMVIIETRDGRTRFARSNRSYRDFMKQSLGMEVKDRSIGFSETPAGPLVPFIKQVLEVVRTEGRGLVDGTLPDKSVVHSFVHRIAVNPVTGTEAIAIVVLTVTEPNERITYANIARALASDYFNIFYVNLRTEDFIEYTADSFGENVAVERHDTEFFRKASEDARTVLYEPDQDAFIEVFTKENVVSTIDEQGSFRLNYRMLKDGKPVYVHMKATRLYSDMDYIIIGVINMDIQTKQRLQMDKLREEQAAYNRVKALLDDFIVLYLVDPESGNYTQSTATAEYDDIGMEESFEDFYESAQTNGWITVSPEDFPLYSSAVTRENILGSIERDGIFSLRYHVLMEEDSEPVPVEMRAAMVDEVDGKYLVVGVKMI